VGHELASGRAPPLAVSRRRALDLRRNQHRTRTPTLNARDDAPYKSTDPVHRSTAGAPRNGAKNVRACSPPARGRCVDGWPGRPGTSARCDASLTIADKSRTNDSFARPQPPTKSTMTRAFALVNPCRRTDTDANYTGLRRWPSRIRPGSGATRFGTLRRWVAQPCCNLCLSCVTGGEGGRFAGLEEVREHQAGDRKMPRVHRP
jgi:hypothetical protein